MKNTKIFRILGIAIILSMLVVALPATPAQAIGDIELNPDSGKVGDRVYLRLNPEPGPSS